jgi:GNAT superfamily N-acetyltransferase
MSTIRKIGTDDFESVKKLIHITIKASYPSIYPQEVINFFLTHHSAEEIKRRADYGIVLVLEEENEIKATGFYMEEEMGGVYVHPNCQKQGYGSMILEKLLDEAKKQKCRYIHLDATPLAKPLYLKFGFDLVGPAVQWVGKIPLHYFKMEKYL